MSMGHTAIVGALGLAVVSCLGACARNDRAARAPVPSPAAIAKPELAGLGTAEHPVIVRLVGRRQVLTVSGGTTGPAYSVADFAGRVMLSYATIDELRESHPDLYQQIRGTVAADVGEAIGYGAPSVPPQLIRVDEVRPIPFAGIADR